MPNVLIAVAFSNKGLKIIPEMGDICWSIVLNLIVLGLVGSIKMAEDEVHSYLIRPMIDEDLETVTEWFLDAADIALFDRSLPVPVNKKAVIESWKTGLELTDPPKALWFVCEHDNGDLAGISGLQSINHLHGDAILPLFIEKKHRGNHLAHALAGGTVDIGFKQLRLNRVSTLYREDNLASGKILNNLGFVEEGRTRKGWFSKGQYMDVINVGVLREEWERNSQNYKKVLQDNRLVVNNTCLIG